MKKRSSTQLPTGASMALPTRAARRRPTAVHCRRRSSPSFRNPGPGAGGGRRSGPATPLLRWKFDDQAGQQQQQPQQRGRCRKQGGNEGEGGGGVGDERRAEAAEISARRLAAGLWQLQRPELSPPGSARVHRRRLGFQSSVGHLQTPHLCNLRTTDRHQESKDDLPSPASVCSSKNNGGVCQRDPLVGFPYPAMERATKWDPVFSKASDEVFRFYGQLNFLEDQQENAVSIVSELRLDLERACLRINDLENERRSSKKKLDHFLKKLAEEKASWRTREHEKVRAIIHGMKDDLNRERKNRQRLEVLNTKLVNELKESKLSAKRHLQDFEKERKARELMEEVCDELAREIGEEKAEVEVLKRESMKIREEVEEERRMLQMAEVWREERVQMKLIDAKLTLEAKHMQLQKLQAEVEAFLRTKAGTNPNVVEVQEAEMLRDAFHLVKLQEITDFSYEPPHASEDIFSVFEELQPAEEAYDREIEPCYGYSPASRTSNIHTVSPEVNGFAGDLMEKRCLNGSVAIEGDIEDDSGWETMSHAEEQGFSNSLDGSDPSVNGTFLENNASVSGTDWDATTENGKLDNEILEVSSATTRQLKKKMSSISRFWKSSCPNNGENCKITVVEGTNGRLSTGRLSNGTVSSDVGFGNVNLSSPSVGQWSSPGSANPHIARGMKGCIEWPKGSHKHSLKAKLLEARMESQKIQLRHVLKQKS